MAAQNLSVQAQLAFPPDLGLQPLVIPSVVTTLFTSYEGGSPLILTGSGTETLNVGTPPAAGLKALLIKVDAVSPTSGSPAPVGVKINGSTVAVEVSPGGFILLASPNPVAGITAVILTYTTDVSVRCWALG